MTLPLTPVLAYDAVRGEVFREGFERRIHSTSQLMMVVIDITNGPWSSPDPLHSHPHEQMTYLAEGELLFLLDGEEPKRMKAGDMIAIPSNFPHSIQLLSERARLIDAFHPIRKDLVG